MVPHHAYHRVRRAAYPAIAPSAKARALKRRSATLPAVAGIPVTTRFVGLSTLARIRARQAVFDASGLRRVEIWAPDTSQPDFLEECRRQTRLAAQADLGDGDLSAFMDAAFADIVRASAL